MERHIGKVGLTDKFRTPETKVCNKCKSQKDISEFAHSAKGRYGYSNECKACKNEADKVRKQKREEYAKNFFTF